eukprot:m.927232 g.927232  ORF g.927232 m.927232 type:complete len:87 (+) comp146899_c0_seq1:82-342(+)
MFAQDDLTQLLEAANSSNLAECQRIVRKCGKDIVTTPGLFSRVCDRRFVGVPSVPRSRFSALLLLFSCCLRFFLARLLISGRFLVR